MVTYVLRHVNVRHELLLRQLLNYPLRWHHTFLALLLALSSGTCIAAIAVECNLGNQRMYRVRSGIQDSSSQAQTKVGNSECQDCSYESTNQLTQQAGITCIRG